MLWCGPLPSSPCGLWAVNGDGGGERTALCPPGRLSVDFSWCAADGCKISGKHIRRHVNIVRKVVFPFVLSSVGMPDKCYYASLRPWIGTTVDALVMRHVTLQACCSPTVGMLAWHLPLRGGLQNERQSCTASGQAAGVQDCRSLRFGSRSGSRQAILLWPSRRQRCTRQGQDRREPCHLGRCRAAVCRRWNRR